MTDWSTVRLASPWFLLLALLVPLAGLLRRRRQPALVFSAVSLLNVESPKSWRLRLLWLRELLCGVWLILLIIALARPQTPDEATAIAREGISILFAVDVSGSMAAREAVGPNGPITRLDQVKAFVRDFVADSNGMPRRPNDFVGLIAFSRRPRVVCPLTHSHETALELLNGLEVDQLENRTNLGDAVALAVERLADQSTTDKALIVCSDGAHNVEEAMNPGESARIAAALGLRIHTVGVGSGDDRAAGRDEKTLRRLAELTGGRYFRATDADSLAAAGAALAELEPAHSMIEGYRRWRDRFAEVLVLALVVCLLDTLLQTTWLRIQPE